MNVKETCSTDAFERRQPKRRLLSNAAVAVLFSVAVACASPEERVERFSSEGQEFLEAGQYGKANVQFQNALKIDEDHVPSLVGLATIVEERKDFQGMFGILQRIVRLDPNQLDSQVKLGKLYLIGSDEATALEHAEKALDIDPNHNGALALKAAIQLKAGDNIGAVELASRVVANDPTNAEAVTVLVTERASAGDNEKALELLETALESNPEIAVLQLLRIQLLKNLDRADAVRAAYAELIELFPGQTAYRRVYTSELLSVANYVEAQEQLEAIVGLEPENIDAKLDVIRVINSNPAIGQAGAGDKFRSYIDAEPENTELKFTYVDFLREIGDNDGAIAQLNELVESSDPDVVLRAKNEIAEDFFTNGDWEEAERLVNEILAADAENTAGLVKRASIKIRAEEYDSAIIDLRTALDNSPDLPEALVAMATAFERQGSISSARAELARAFDTSGRNPRVSNIFARFLIRHDDSPRAEEVLENSLASFPGNADNLRLLASVRLSLQDWRGAEEVAQILENIGDDSEDIDRIRSEAFAGLGDFNGVIETLTARNEEAPLESRPLSTLVAAYLQSERFDEAEELLNRIIAGDGDTYPARILLAQVEAVRGEVDSAISVLQAAVAAEPTRAVAYELLYRHFLQSGQPDRAIQLIDQGLERAPDNSALRIFKADLYLGEADFESAFDIYSSLIDERPNDVLIANNFVSLSSDLRTDQASVQKALEYTSILEGMDNPAFYDTIGWANYRAGKLEKAVDFLEKAVESAGDNAEILYHLGAAQLASGDAEDARVNLEKALSVGGEEFRFATEVQELLGQL